MMGFFSWYVHAVYSTRPHVVVIEKEGECFIVDFSSTFYENVQLKMQEKVDKDDYLQQKIKEDLEKKNVVPIVCGVLRLYDGVVITTALHKLEIGCVVRIWDLLKLRQMGMTKILRKE